jgi:hypothetical protein
MMNRILCPFVFGVLGLALVSCNRSEVTYYEAPKDTTAAPAASVEMPPDHPPIGSTSMADMRDQTLPGFTAPVNQTELRWTSPDVWMEMSGSSVRLASFGIEGVDRSAFDMAVTRFPGDVGGIFSNVNRWRGQIGLAPYSSASQAEADARRVKSDAFEFVVFYMANEANPPIATRVAILELNGFSWFFKLTGTRDLIDEHEAAFHQFLLSIQPGVSA